MKSKTCTECDGFLYIKKCEKGLMPCPFTGPKIFFVSDQKFFYILPVTNICARRKDDLHSVKLVFVPTLKVFEEALNAVKFLGWLKNFVRHKKFLDL